MASKLVASGGAALALLMVLSLFDPADAGRSGGSYSSGPKMGGYSSGPKMGSYSGPKMGSYSGPKMGSYSSGPKMGGHPNKFTGKFHHGHRHFRHRHVFIGAPLVYGAYDYGEGCYWLRRKALYTGSSYWWNRYNACLYGYGYY